LRKSGLSAPGEIFSRGKWKKNEKAKKLDRGIPTVGRSVDSKKGKQKAWH
jgi:hypothetical protein